LLSGLPLPGSFRRVGFEHIDQPPRGAGDPSIARLNASRLAFDGAVKPLIFRTNCTDAARTSSRRPAAQKLKSGECFCIMIEGLGVLGS
jgi:hypothetical protein